jgi:shikimate kinase
VVEIRLKKEDIDLRKKINIAIIGMPGSGDNAIMMIVQ